MAKIDFKALMLARGEKFLLIGALGLGVLLLVWGTISGLSSTDPVQGKKDLEQGAQQVKSKMGRNDPPATTTEKSKLPEFTHVPDGQFRVAANPFEPTAWPSLRREPPVALAPIDSQIDFYHVNVRKNPRDNFVFEDGKLIDFDAMWVTKLTDTKVDHKESIKLITDNLPGRKPKKPNQPSGGGGVPPGGGPPGGGGGVPPGGGPPGGGGGGGVPPGGGPPGGGGGFRPPSGFGGSSGGPPGGFGGGEGPYGSGYGGMKPGELSKTKTSEDVVEWRKFSKVKEDAKATAVPAYGVFPVRMAVVQLSFPLEKQLEEIQRALRLPNLQEAIKETSPSALLVKDPETGLPVQYTTVFGGGGAGGIVGGGVAPMPPGGGVGGGGQFVPPPGFGSGGMSPKPGGVGGGLDGPNPPAGGGNTPLNLNAIAAPVFAGFEVQRRITYPDGTVGAWENYDHADRWYNEFKLYDAPIKPDTGYLPYFLRLEQGLAAPMPEVAPNWTSVPQLVAGEPEPKDKHYPEWVRMPSIVTDYEALQKLAKPVKKKEALEKYSKNPNNPYGVSGSQTTGTIPGVGGGPSPGGGDGEEGPGIGGYVGSMGYKPPPGGGTTPKPPSGGGTTTQPTTPTKGQGLPVKHMLIRFLDTDLAPGVSYEYQVRVSIRNPNYGKKDKVADNKQAEVETIESNWYQCKQTLRVPGEEQMYAGSPKEYEKKVATLIEHVRESSKDKSGKDLDPNQNAPAQLKKLFEVNEVKDGRRAVVQLHRWVPQIKFGGEDEPIGAWVQADLPVAPGEFIGRRTLVELPLWKAALGKYTLTPPNKQVVERWPKDVPNPVGRPVDFRTAHVLLDFEGGKVYNPDLKVQDDAATELLVLRADGSLEVRKEAADTGNADRVVRDTKWKEWIEMVRKQTERVVTGTDPSGGGRRGGGD